MLNVVAIMGRLVADPELRTTTQGHSVCSFRIACDRSYVQQAKAAQNAPQPAYTQGSMDDFAVINDNDDLPF